MCCHFQRRAPAAGCAQRPTGTNVVIDGSRTSGPQLMVGEFIMSKKLAIALTVVLLALVAWALLLESNSFSIVVNGQPVTGPLKGAIGSAGLVAALISGFVQQSSCCLPSRVRQSSCWEVSYLPA